MHFATPALVALALAAVFAAEAHADVIYTRQLESTLYISNAGAIPPFPDQMRVLFGAGPKSLTPAQLVSTSLFDDSAFSAQTVGQTWTSTPASDPDFAAIASVITNGVEDNDYVGLEAHHGPGGADVAKSTVIGSEKGMFFFFGTTDLAGYTLSSISVTLDSFHVDENYAPNPLNPTDTGHRYVADYTLSFSNVPEPTSLACLGALAAPVLLRRRRK